MTKNELLLNVAIRAMGWGEGADFEMTELIHENSELCQQFEKHYGVLSPDDERGWDEDHYESLSEPEKKAYEKAHIVKREVEVKAWNKALKDCKHDAISLLRQLKKTYECPVYAKEKMEKELAHLVKHANNPKFYLKGKLEAIELYRKEKECTLKESYDYVSEHGWTREGKYK